ncbi:DMT family transporter [Gallaecimonas mangrovi]|uniref:DMT family transporter n=1 Tax=Gallaecimonas mangrovi TaxID=2291597 RepID=UPI000E1FE86D|nr:DMT family transporter [Gallaecimonas mangrovi]
MTWLLYTAVVLIWGSTWLAIGLQQGPVAATVSVFYRFLLASVLLLTVLALSRRLKAIGTVGHGWCLVQGACVFGFNFYCFYHAAAHISTGMEAVIFSMAVVFNAFNGALFFRQPLPPGLWLAALLGLGGMLVLFWPELATVRPNRAFFTGIGLSMLGSYCFSLGNMISQQHQRQGRDLFSTNAWGMAYGALLMGLLALTQHETFRLDWRPSYLGALLYLVVFGSILGFGAYFALIHRIGASQAAYSTLLFPLVALVISTVVEGYQWQPHTVLGVSLILLGNLAILPRVRLGLRRWRSAIGRWSG